MAKIQIKSEKLTPFGGIFSIMEQFDSTLSSVIDSILGLRCKSFGYRCSEIIRSLMSIYYCGGSCIEDVTTHLMNHLSLHPTYRCILTNDYESSVREIVEFYNLRGGKERIKLVYIILEQSIYRGILLILPDSYHTLVIGLP